MVTVLIKENRNALAARVASGEVSFEKAVTGLAQAEVRIFYRKLDKAFRTKHAKSFKSDLGLTFSVDSNQPDQGFGFSREAYGSFKIQEYHLSKKPMRFPRIHGVSGNHKVQ